MGTPVRAILIDFGDTLAAEPSERKDARGVTVAADLLPGARDAVRTLRARGHRLALVADCVPGTGRASYDNVLAQHALGDCFDAIVTSDDAGADKPDARIFRLALGALGATPGAAAMVGNRLERDVAGARRLGIAAIWLPSARYRRVPRAPDERPDATIAALSELPGTIDALDALYRSTEPA